MSDMADDDWMAKFFGWSTQNAVHPRSPSGAGGPGAFRLPEYLPGSPLSPVPPANSPVGRHTEWQSTLSRVNDPPRQDAETEPISGSMPVAAGIGSVVRIPVPGTKGLALELSPRGWTPKGGSTSSLFIQDITGKRHLRLDYGYNKATNRVEWHWNQKGVAKDFGITNHTPVGTAEQVLGSAAKYYKYAGRVLLVVGVAVDAYSIVTSSKPLRRTIQVVSAWAAAGAGCEAVGAGGALGGTAVAPGIGTAVGGFLGCAVGGFIGYMTAEAAAGYLYDWAEGTIFTKVDPSDAPPAFVGGGGQFGGGGASGSW
jgi:hypothetical protein